MKKIPLIFAGIFLPGISHAHVKWFVESEEIIPKETVHFSLNDPFVLTWIFLIFGIIILSYYLEKQLINPYPFFKKIQKWEEQIIWVTKIATALWLIILSLNGQILAKPFLVTSTIEKGLQLLQFIIAAGLISNRFQRTNAILLIFLYFGSLIHYGSVILEHIFVLGLAFHFLFAPQKKKDSFYPYKEWSLPLLRIFTGISLVILAFNEKLLHPELGLTFLQSHNWNFMQLMGIDWFTNNLFVLSAGMTELLFGIILILGTITRINTLALTFIFVSTTMVLGPNELFGHLPLFAIAFTLILYGSGKKGIITNLLPLKT